MKRVFPFFVLLSVCAWMFSASGTASVPDRMFYQGHLTDEEGAPLDTVISMTFTIYDDSTGGVSWWSETQDSVTVAQGLFNVILGSANPINDSAFMTPGRWLGLTIGFDPEITPRTELVSVPWAFRVATVDGASGGMINTGMEVLGNVDASGFSIEGVPVGTSSDSYWSQSGDDIFYALGNVGIGTTTPTEALDVDGNIHASGTIASGSSITIDGTTDQITATSGRIDFDDENIVTTGKATIGPGHTNSGPYAFVAGQDNEASGDRASVGGGNLNTASGERSVVGGGVANVASGWTSTVAGGSDNQASARSATVGGGGQNNATDTSATVSGGKFNTAGKRATVSGGEFNEATAGYATVAGGYNNAATGFLSTVSGGWGNTANLEGSVVAGGTENLADTNYATVSGGQFNIAVSLFSTISGGGYNQASGYGSVIGGGYTDTASGHLATVSGGSFNTASNQWSTVSGGWVNRAAGEYSTVGGGQSNIASEQAAIVAGGIGNQARARESAIGGGWNNATDGQWSNVSGGYASTAAADFSHIGGGWHNYVEGEYSAILGGYADTVGASADYSYLFGIGSRLDDDSTFMVDLPHIFLQGEIIHASEGDTVAALTAFEDGGGFIGTNGPNGNLNAALTAISAADNNHGAVGVLNADGEWRVGIYSDPYYTGDRGVVETYGPNGNTNIKLWNALVDENAGCVSVADAAGEYRGHFLVTDDSAGLLTLRGPNDNLNVVLRNVEGDPNRGSMGVCDNDGWMRAEMYANDGNSGILHLLDPNNYYNVYIGNMPDGYDRGQIIVCDSIGISQAGVEVNASGQGIVWGDVKSFRVANPNEPGTDIWYSCLEGPEAAAYVRGTGHLVNGRASVSLPDHFTAVASSKGITVQVTPLSGESKGLAVVEKGTEKFAVRELNNGNGTYDFDFMVTAVRKGHEDYQVIRAAMRTQLPALGAAPVAAPRVAPEGSDVQLLKGPGR